MHGLAVMQSIPSEPSLQLAKNVTIEHTSGSLAVLQLFIQLLVSRGKTSPDKVFVSGRGNLSS